jgi:lysophospholipase L1-like esterase
VSWLLAFCVAIVAATAGMSASVRGAVGTGHRGASAPPTTSGILKRPARIVQLGDSIASGEGTLYGYTYDAKKGEWTGGDIDVKWPGPYPDCHVSPDAYGKRIASSFAAAFSQFACTGATFENGISAPETSGSKTLRPAEFGNWGTKQHLNEEYDDARPDLVLVTLGADDAQFVQIVEDCIKNAYYYASYLAKEACIPSNPGATIQSDFLNFIPTLQQNYKTLISWIEARAHDKVIGAPTPKIVLTTYPNPFPNPGARCADVNNLYAEQVTYLSSLVTQMNNAIISTVQGLNDSSVNVVDLSTVYQPANQDHRWCTNDPWAYGLSIYSAYHPSSFYSQAPFHPTPEGQRRIADALSPRILALFNPNLPAGAPTSTTSSTATSAPTTTTTPAPTTTTSPASTTTSTG